MQARDLADRRPEFSALGIRLFAISFQTESIEMLKEVSHTRADRVW